MRVLIASKILVVAAYRHKLDEIAARPEVERLVVVTPPSWREPGGRTLRLEPPTGPPAYELRVEPIRFNGSYNRFTETLYSQALAAAATGTNVVFGHQDLYGGDVDAQLDLAHNSSRMKMYLFGGGGWYRERTVFKQLTQQQGTVCYFYCFPALFDVISTAERTTTPWRKSWNAGFGMEFALADPVSFFIEARYLRIAPYSANDAYIPIQIGLRF